MNCCDVVASAHNHDYDNQMRDLIDRLNNTAIRDEFEKYGENIGPITDSTKKLYIQRLQSLKTGSIKPKQLPLANYCDELNSIIDGRFSYSLAEQLFQQLTEFYKKKTQRFGRHYNYLLMDPTIAEYICGTDSKQFNNELFIKFISSIFYVGKGEGNRTAQHFYVANKYYANDALPYHSSDRIKQINKIWSENKAVISHRSFNNICSEEAYTREALMIDTLSINNLTNKIKGHTIQTIKDEFKWNTHKQRVVGSYLLYQSFLSLISN